MTVLLALVAYLDPVLHAGPNDFCSFYYAGRAAARHADLYNTPGLRDLAAADPDRVWVYPYLYPPFLAYAMRAFGAMPLHAVHSIWIKALVGSTAVIGFITCAFHRQWRNDDMNPRHSILMSIAIAAICVYALPIGDNFKMGQVNLFVTAFVAISCACFFRARHGLAGALLAPAVLIKLTPLVFVLFFVARRSLRALGGFVLCAGALVGITLRLGAASAWLNYIRHLPKVGYGHEISDLFPISSICNFSVSGELVRLGISRPEGSASLSMLVPIVCLVTSFACAFRARGRREEALALALFSPIMILAAPLNYRHHVVFLLPSAVIWLIWAWVEGKTVVFCFLVFLLTIGGIDWPALYDSLPLPLSATTFKAINLYAIIALWGIGVGAWVFRGPSVGALGIPAPSKDLRFDRSAVADER